MDKRKMIIISKYLSYVLRHAPESIGLHLEKGGWVSVDELLCASVKHGNPISKNDLKEVVKKNEKQRYSFNEDGTRIRANQGHSIPVDLELDSKEPPEYLYHGTVEKSLNEILKSGINRGQRNHVHLSPDVITARKVGARRGKPVVLTIEAKRMYKDGYAFYLSDNGVWLTDLVPSCYVHLNCNL